MNERAVVDKVNRIMNEAGYHMDITDIPDVEDFLNNKDNMRMSIYEEVEQLYSELMEDVDI